MALKDWKQIGTSEWQSKNEFLKVDTIEWKDGSYSKHWFSKGDVYMVLTTQTSWPMSVNSRKGFKTKSQALMYAKLYMRTH